MTEDCGLGTIKGLDQRIKGLDWKFADFVPSEISHGIDFNWTLDPGISIQ